METCYLLVFTANIQKYFLSGDHNKVTVKGPFADLIVEKRTWDFPLFSFPPQSMRLQCVTLYKIRQQVTSQKYNKAHAWIKRTNIKEKPLTLLYLKHTDYIDDLYLLTVNN